MIPYFSKSGINSEVFLDKSLGSWLSVLRWYPKNQDNDNDLVNMYFWFYSVTITNNHIHIIHYSYDDHVNVCCLQ